MYELNWFLNYIIIHHSCGSLDHELQNKISHYCVTFNFLIMLLFVVITVTCATKSHLCWSISCSIVIIFNSSLNEIFSSQLQFGCGPGHWYLSQLLAGEPRVTHPKVTSGHVLDFLRTADCSSSSSRLGCACAGSSLCSALTESQTGYLLCLRLRSGSFDRRSLERSCQISHFLCREAEPNWIFIASN